MATRQLTLARLAGARKRSIGLFLLAASVYWLSPIHQVCDSRYSMLLSHQILHHGSFRLESYFPAGVPDAHDPRLVPIGEHIYYGYPPGSSVLLLPLVGALELLGESVVTPSGAYDADAEDRIQGWIAGLLMALFVVQTESLARLLVPARESLLIALGIAFGSAVWSTASRALWSHTCSLLLVGVVLRHLLTRHLRGCPPSPRWLGALLAVHYWTRPTAVAHIAVVAWYLWTWHRPLLGAYLRSGFRWTAVFLVHSWFCFQKLLPPYYQSSSFSLWGFPAGAWGVLLSPSRGLLVYSPILLWVAYRLLRHWRSLPHQAFARFLLLAVGAHLALISTWVMWWGGHSYGPRLATCVLPWLAVLGALALGAAPLGRAEKLVASGLLGLSMALHGIGAFSLDAWDWNSRLTQLDHSRLYDWRRAQFLAVFQWPFPQDQAIAPLDQKIFLARTHGTAYLGAGWSDPDGEARWTVAHAAEFWFRRPIDTPARLTLKLQPFLFHKRHETQRVRLSLNDQTLGTITLASPTPIQWEVPIPAAALRSINHLVLEPLDAVSPRSLGINDDDRPRGAGVWWLEFEPG